MGNKYIRLIRNDVSISQPVAGFISGCDYSGTAACLNDLFLYGITGGKGNKTGKGDIGTVLCACHSRAIFTQEIFDAPKAIIISGHREGNPLLPFDQKGILAECLRER